MTTAIIVSSCEEDPTSLGSDLLPGKDFVVIKSTDTIGVGVYTQYMDSVITNNRPYSFLGNLYDPYFGKTVTDFVAQLRLTEKWPGGGPPIIDSVKITFTIIGATGTLDSTIHQIKISEIGEKLNSATSYFSTRDPDDINDLGTFDLPVIPKDTVQTISILIPNSVGEYLMRDSVRLNQDYDSIDFRSFFRGVHISIVDSPKPMILALDLSTDVTPFFITVYYQNNKATTEQSYDFLINASSVRYNRYFHNFTTAAPLTRIKHINDGVKDTLSYLQSFNGVYPRIKIPGLDIYKNLMPISVNKAKLIFSVYFDNDIFTEADAPSQIFLSYVAADTTRNILPDFLINSTYFDGTFLLTKKTYTFNIASFVQLYLAGKIPKPEVEMYLPETEHRNVILKSNNSVTPAKFELTYTLY
jgi:hypothetical protein